MKHTKVYLILIISIIVMFSFTFVGLLSVNNNSKSNNYVDVRNVGYMPTQYEIIKLNIDGSIYSKETFWK